MIDWRPADCEEVAAPDVAINLLARAIARDPSNPDLRLKLAGLALDRYDFAAAAAALETARELAPAAPRLGPSLAHCYNILGRPQQAVDILAGDDVPRHERAVALLALGRTQEAERELRAVLAGNPHHRHACRELGKLLRRADRIGELVSLCEDLAARRACHAQLFYTWGVALALAGDDERARALLLDARRIAEIQLPVPDGFADIVAFNAALADEILSNPHRLTDFPRGEEANRGSSRVQALFAGRRPNLIRALLETIQRTVDDCSPAPLGAFDPWPEARPASAHLKAWGLIQRGGDYEEWHLHRGGWLSGVYYIRLPATVSAAGDGPGCIEFGAPTALQRAMPGYVPVQRYRPHEGMLLLAPSHYPHRTIPTGADEYRISFAFDVVPERTASEPGPEA